MTQRIKAIAETAAFRQEAFAIVLQYAVLGAIAGGCAAYLVSL